MDRLCLEHMYAVSGNECIMYYGRQPLAKIHDQRQHTTTPTIHPLTINREHQHTQTSGKKKEERKIDRAVGKLPVGHSLRWYTARCRQWQNVSVSVTLLLSLSLNHERLTLAQNTLNGDTQEHKRQYCSIKF